MSGMKSARSMARRCSGVEKASRIGFLEVPPSSWSFLKFGVSSSERRITKPMTPSGTATRKGTRHAMAPNPPPSTASAVSQGDMP